MFARFVCVLFGFCAHDFPAKSEKDLYFSLTAGSILSTEYIREPMFPVMDPGIYHIQGRFGK